MNALSGTKVQVLRITAIAYDSCVGNPKVMIFIKGETMNALSGTKVRVLRITAIACDSCVVPGVIKFIYFL